MSLINFLRTLTLSDLTVKTVVESSLKKRQLTERSCVGSTVCISAEVYMMVQIEVCCDIPAAVRIGVWS
jgi:hypothetical protein